MNTLTGVVLAGGYSLRMKKDKTRLCLPSLSVPLLQHAIALLEQVLPQGSDIVIAGRLDTAWDVSTRVIADIYSGIGPMAGIHATLSTVGGAILIIPVDVPLLSNEVLQRLVDTYVLSGDTESLMFCYCAEDTGAVEPLISIIRKGALPYIEQAIEKGCLRIIEAIPEAYQHHIVYNKTQEQYFCNVNTPEDIATMGVLFEAMQRR